MNCCGRIVEPAGLHADRTGTIFKAALATLYA
ncbi:hypothetical protein [Rhizobium sp. AAP43]